MRSSSPRTRPVRRSPTTLRRVHRDLFARDGAARRAETREDHRVTTWQGRVGRRLDPGVGVPPRDDAELLPYDCEATAEHAPPGRRRPAERRRARRTREPAGGDRSDPGGVPRLGRGRAFGNRALLGEVGRKIHAGRSRNDQVAAALRLYVLDGCAEARDAIDSLALVVLSFAESEASTVMPGYTPPASATGRARPPPARLGRDAGPRPDQFAAAAEAASESPLGAGALAGSTLELPQPPRQMRNSIDAVADRDFALDYLYAAALLFTHLSRIGEEISLWATAEFGARFRRPPRQAPR